MRWYRSLQTARSWEPGSKTTKAMKNQQEPEFREFRLFPESLAGSHWEGFRELWQALMVLFLAGLVVLFWQALMVLFFWLLSCFFLADSHGASSWQAFMVLFWQAFMVLFLGRLSLCFFGTLSWCFCLCRQFSNSILNSAFWVGKNTQVQFCVA